MLYMNFNLKRNEIKKDDFWGTPFSKKNENCDTLLKDKLKQNNFIDVNKYPNLFFIQKKLCNVLNIRTDQLVFGHGSDDILKNLFLTLNYNSIQMLEHSYKMSFFYNELLNKKILVNTFLYKNKKFNLNHDIVKLGGDILYIVNPHCPTTFKIDPNEIINLSIYFKYIIIDEAYCNPLYHFSEYLKTKNIIVVKTFSKLGGSPGLRIGYCMCSDKHVMNNMRIISSNYNLNSEAIRYLDFIIENQKIILDSQFELTKGFEYISKKINKPSFFSANFALFEYDSKLKNIGVEYVIDGHKFIRITLTNDFVFKKII